MFEGLMKQYIGSFIRAQLQVLAGALAALGVMISNEEQTALGNALAAFLGSLLIQAGTLAWSWFQKKKLAVKVEELKLSQK